VSISIKIYYIWSEKLAPTYQKNFKVQEKKNFEYQANIIWIPNRSFNAQIYDRERLCWQRFVIDVSKSIQVQFLVPFKRSFFGQNIVPGHRCCVISQLWLDRKRGGIKNLAVKQFFHITFHFMTEKGERVQKSPFILFRQFLRPSILWHIVVPSLLNQLKRV